jgi:hypothetical protein
VQLKGYLSVTTKLRIQTLFGVGSLLASTVLFLAVSSSLASAQQCLQNSRGFGCTAFQQSVPWQANAASLASQNALESQLQTIRDMIQAGKNRTPATPLGFASDPSTIDDDVLGYSDDKSARLKRNPLYVTKAPPPQPANAGWAVWGEGFIDHEERSGTFLGTDIGRNTTSVGGIAGIDKTFSNVLSASDAVVIGLLTGDLSSHVDAATGETSRIAGPSIGAYGMYVNGGFSADATYKADFLGVNETTAGALSAPSLVNQTIQGDLNYKYDMSSAWWVEPTIGLSDTVTSWNTTGTVLGLANGEDVRVQGGARFGTSNVWNKVPVEWTVGAYGYDDVRITGGTLAALVTPLAPTDEGKMFGKLNSKLNFDWGQGWSTYAEGEIRGRTDVFGVAGRLGVRYQW